MGLWFILELAKVNKYNFFDTEDEEKQKWETETEHIF